MKLPKFVDVKFYPGYSYGSNPERIASGRYVALGADGKVYCLILAGHGTWEVLGDKQYGQE